MDKNINLKKVQMMNQALESRQSAHNRQNEFDRIHQALSSNDELTIGTFQSKSKDSTGISKDGVDLLNEEPFIKIESDKNR